MINTTNKANDISDDRCTVPTEPIPAEVLGRYSVDRDPPSEEDIISYVRGQARDEEVLHVERIKTEFVIGESFEIWDVTTDTDRWWVITNLTNLYSQRHFPSLDYTLSFHIGLMMRLRSRPEGADAENPTPFDDVFRRQEQAKDRYDHAVEAEEYQAVGMQLRECLISLTMCVRRQIEFDEDSQLPQDANFVDWIELIANKLCGGKSNKVLRSYLKNTAKETWQLVNWLTHCRKADNTVSMASITATDNVIGNVYQLLVREKIDHMNNCPQCNSRDIRSHFDMLIDPDGGYYATCGVCDWSSHPNAS